MATGYDTLANFVNQEADYNFASGLEMLKKGGRWLMDATSPFSQAVSEPLNQDIKAFADMVNQSGVGRAVAKGAQAVQESGADYGMPVGPMMGVIRSNMRTPQQIQALRKTIAEEMRSRGPVATVSPELGPSSRISPSTKAVSDLADLNAFDSETISRARSAWGSKDSRLAQEGPDPFDLILRGTPYHGMSEKARYALPGTSTQAERMMASEDYRLALANKTGFPLSLHNSQSMSNKWGEPAGVSTSFLPTKSGTMFSPDEYIHRLLPLYGGPPRERVVNLMEQSGRETLRDAYSGALEKYFNASPEHFDVLAKYARRGIDNNWASSYPYKADPLRNFLEEAKHSSDAVGQFNLGLSNELQSMGKRGILYNPQRYDEYEMLMLDPKYILPLDYRKWQEFGHPSSTRASRDPVGSVESKVATPGVRRGLSQIEELMRLNHSRLGDIYSERPWQGYLSPEVKESLLERVGPDYREQVGNMLNDLRHRNLDIPY